MVFCYCENLEQVIFEPGSAVEEIQYQVFSHSGLKSFTAPPSLRKIGDMAFESCSALREFELNEDIQDLGWLCLLGTAVINLRLPPHIRRTPEQLGVGQDPKVLRLPDGLEVVEEFWFCHYGMEKLIVSNTVRVLEQCAFGECERLREVVFEPGSRLEFIGKECFHDNGLQKIVIPKSVREIGEMAFRNCRDLSSLSFEKGSALKEVGAHVFSGTQLRQDNVVYPKTLRKKDHG